MSSNTNDAEIIKQTINFINLIDSLMFSLKSTSIYLNSNYCKAKEEIQQLKNDLVLIEDIIKLEQTKSIIQIDKQRIKERNIIKVTEKDTYFRKGYHLYIIIYLQLLSL